MAMAPLSTANMENTISTGAFHILAFISYAGWRTCSIWPDVQPLTMDLARVVDNVDMIVLSGPLSSGLVDTLPLPVNRGRSVRVYHRFTYTII
ncbi:unnamed protein product [Macrosiphum euphorbiae]|uniref:Uncharacterized protein n=1 Tax=Macrosiphum euphorbiae TaxID=13131 RepID=A0AAV0XNT1_9HEMI|nr:unnamed protein product [Macrosiphum euphorbiae]